MGWISEPIRLHLITAKRGAAPMGRPWNPNGPQALMGLQWHLCCSRPDRPMEQVPAAACSAFTLLKTRFYS